MKAAPSNLNLIPRSMCARLLIHIIGDIHQPLHTSALFSELFPDGDLGGNKFEIVYEKRKSLNNLHSFWDSTAHQYGEIKVPIDEKKYDKLMVIADEVLEEFPRSKLNDQLKLKTFDEWVESIGKKAKKDVYQDLNLHSGDKITDEYLAQAQLIVREELALGGYRLADWLVLHLGKSTPTEEVSL